MHKAYALLLLMPYLALLSSIASISPRLLESVEYGPIRFYVEYDEELGKEDELIQKNLKKIMSIVLEFWSQTVEIDYLP